MVISNLFRSALLTAGASLALASAAFAADPPAPNASPAAAPAVQPAVNATPAEAAKPVTPAPAATSAPAATPEAALTRLAPAALALARLSERLRYLSMQELAERHIAGDAGVAPAPPASGAVTGALTAAAHAHDREHAAHAEQRAVQLSEGPVARELELAIRLERDVIRNLGAYLEYGPLPVRRAAFSTSKALQAQHPRWPAHTRLLSEASVLESDAALKAELRELAATGVPQRAPAAAQSAETK